MRVNQDLNVGWSKRAALSLAALSLAGCVQVAPPQAADLPVEVPRQWSAGSVGVAATPIDTGWLEAFGDTELTALVQEALAGNLELRAALARLDQARALARIEGAGRWPDLSMGGSARRAMANNLADPPLRSRSDRFGIEAVASWELDLWGRVRAQALAADADALAAEADLAAFRLSLGSRVAQAWFSAIEARQQEQLALETLVSFESNLTTVEERFERGLSPALDVRLTRANVANARSTHAREQRLADLATRQLEVLLGRYPAGAIAVGEGLPQLRQTVPAGLPSDLLLRRPDLLATAQRLMAAEARTIESRRALLPAIRLTGSYGRASGELEDLLKDSFDVWSLIGNLTAPVFQGGRLRANVARADARMAELAASYQQTVLTAFREVESALAGEAFLRAQLESVKAAAEESTGAQRLAEERYERGLTDIITVLESQRRAFTTRSAVITVQNQLLQNRLSLYLALGGDMR
jgi:NodT family efflux transporter outer membrane factor (OMF) lipoprotein